MIGAYFLNSISGLTQISIYNMRLKNIYILLAAVSIIFLAFFSKESDNENRTNKDIINFSHPNLYDNLHNPFHYLNEIYG